MPTSMQQARTVTEQCRYRIANTAESRHLDRLQDVLDHIAYDKEYYMPENNYAMGR